MEKKGYIQTYTGLSKGKTTSAFGLALRAMAYNWKIFVIQFMKGDPKFDYGEIRSCERFKDLIKVYQVRLEAKKIIKMLQGDKDAFEECKRKTIRGFNYFLNELKRNKYDMVILDEILPSLDNYLIPIELFKSFIDNRDKTMEIVLTGRMKRLELISYITTISDYFSKLKAVKHPFEKKCPKCGKIFRNEESYFEGCPYCVVKLVKVTARKAIEY